jgi:hypothetical protein
MRTNRRSDFSYRRPGNAKQLEIERAAQLLLDTVIAEGTLRRKGNEFLQAARGLDQRLVVEAAAARLLKSYPNAPFDRAADVVWQDVQRLFGWAGDITDLAIGGHA